jgi:RNA polymerase sigma factor (sigma-70 family)
VGTSVCATSDGAPLVDERTAASREPRSGEASFECVYSTHVEFVWRSALRLGVDEFAADDVVQQVFLVVYKSLDAFEWRSTLKTWLFSILLRVAQDHRRAIRRNGAHLVREAVDTDLVADGAPRGVGDSVLSETAGKRDSANGDDRLRSGTTGNGPILRNDIAPLRHTLGCARSWRSMVGGSDVS